jgi:L-ascorbate metabolism protein UlaG (beta-lactamase superfamily)
MEIGDIELKWLGHAGFLIAPKGVPSSEGKNSKIIYIDPYQIAEGSEKADLILITHSHYDHCSVEDLMKIVQPGTRILVPADCQSKILKFDVPVKIEIVEPGQEFNFPEIKVSTLPAYNIDKPFHSKDEGWVGYLVKMKNVLIYHAGDTDNIPEMQKLTGYKQSGVEFVALLPVGGRFTMTAEEAVEAAGVIQPSLAIPMHYGVVSGTEEDAKEFFALCMEQGLNSKVLEKS